MTDPARAERASSESASEPADSDDAAYDRKKRVLVMAAAALVSGLAFAGSLDRNSVGNTRVVAGIIVLAAWVGAALALHRLGRAGASR